MKPPTTRLESTAADNSNESETANAQLDSYTCLCDFVVDPPVPPALPRKLLGLLLPTLPGILPRKLLGRRPSQLPPGLPALLRAGLPAKLSGSLLPSPLVSPLAELRGKLPAKLLGKPVTGFLPELSAELLRTLLSTPPGGRGRVFCGNRG